MAERFLEEIYQYANLIAAFQHVVEYLRVGDSLHAEKLLMMNAEKVENTCRDCQKCGYEKAEYLCNAVKHIYQIEEDSTINAAKTLHPSL